MGPDLDAQGDRPVLSLPRISPGHFEPVRFGRLRRALRQRGNEAVGECPVSRVPGVGQSIGPGLSSSGEHDHFPVHVREVGSYSTYMMEGY